jgi:hypothetical protein
MSPAMCIAGCEGKDDLVLLVNRIGFICVFCREVYADSRPECSNFRQPLRGRVWGSVGPNDGNNCLCGETRWSNAGKKISHPEVACFPSPSVMVDRRLLIVDVMLSFWWFIDRLRLCRRCRFSWQYPTRRGLQESWKCAVQHQVLYHRPHHARSVFLEWREADEGRHYSASACRG